MRNHVLKSLSAKLATIVVYLILSSTTAPLWADPAETLLKAIGKRDAIILSDPEGNITISKHASQNLVPASTLKVITALAALHYLGTDFRYRTEFYKDRRNNLKIKGYGDPLLISEVLPGIAEDLSQKIRKSDNLILDDSYYTQPLVIPGISSSTEPYDAPNGALCVNFNTVYFKSHGGKYLSAESQTPLLPFALKRIRKTGIKDGRIVFTHHNHEITLYAGYLFQYFFKSKGIHMTGRVQLGKIQKDDVLVHTYVSEFSLEDYIQKFLEFSNNYMTNQILISMGIRRYGPPGSLSKGVKALMTYARDHLGLLDVHFLEGSGISRSNSISARDLHIALEAFRPYFHLMKYEDGEYFKTGTLKGVSNRAGYILDQQGRLHSYVVLINTPGKYSPQVVGYLKNLVRF